MSKRCLLAVSAVALSALATASCDEDTEVGSNAPAPRDTRSFDAGRGTDAGPAPGPASGCLALVKPESTPGVCSIEGNGGALLTVRNNCPQAIETWWVDYDCNEVFYSRIEPGGEADEGSFLTHPWRLRLADGGPLLLEIPALTADPTNVTFP